MNEVEEKEPISETKLSKINDSDCVKDSYPEQDKEKSRKKKRKHSLTKEEKKKKKKDKKNKKKRLKMIAESFSSGSVNIGEKAILPNSSNIIEKSANVASKSKSMAPMTKEEFDKQQSVVRRVYDAATGRHRLIKGDGEVIEEIVSYSRHKQINKMSTQMDGKSFAASIGI
ncbi:ADP-ribosylation factor-like protein 6-interacting protein 4 isoform X1 [Hydra vulgaris]|uniref:ADP-ribosylation factor-like protein 6-interacting protein 4 n=1 Tax=Hydra vulgaris TaxID=6087 RepID=T2MBQ0_HYDVU|nr:ADP-ribosylation factor-like protein 6-interacting protein 4 [Hydra vulgaris]